MVCLDAAQIVRLSLLALLSQTCSAQWFAEVTVGTSDSQYQCGGVFGTFGPIGTIAGKLVATNPYSACTPFHQRLDVMGPWVALVQRGGNCSFYDKIQNAALAGASAVVVGNLRASEVVIMHDARTVHIPAVSVSRSVAVQMELSAEEHQDILISIGPQLTMVNFVLSEILHDAGVFLVFLLTLTTAISVVYYFRRRRFLRALAQRVWAKRARVAAAVDRLPLVVYNAEVGGFMPTTNTSSLTLAPKQPHNSYTHPKAYSSNPNSTNTTHYHGSDESSQSISRTGSLCCACHQKLSTSELRAATNRASALDASASASRDTEICCEKKAKKLMGPTNRVAGEGVPTTSFSVDVPEESSDTANHPDSVYSTYGVPYDHPDACAICLDDFTGGDPQRALPCRHGTHFHRSCIDPWLTLHQTCPLCKTNFLNSTTTSSNGASRSTAGAGMEGQEVGQSPREGGSAINRTGARDGNRFVSGLRGVLRNVGVSIGGPPTDFEGGLNEDEDDDLDAEVSWEQLQQIEEFTADQVPNSDQLLTGTNRFALVLVDPRTLNFDI